MKTLLLVLATIILLAVSGFGQQNEKDNKRLEKRIKQAVDLASGLRFTEKHAGRSFDLQLAYLPKKDNNTVCLVYHNGFGKISVFMRGASAVTSYDGAGAELLIDNSCARNGQLVPGTDITKEAVHRLAALAVPGLKDLK